MKTRSPDIQKRPVTDCPKGARIGVSLGLVREKSENRFSLWTPVSHLESVRDLPW